jgi:hypothetical protein
VIDELIQRLEFPLSDAVHAGLDVHAKVFIAAGRFQGHGIVAHLERIFGGLFRFKISRHFF